MSVPNLKVLCVKDAVSALKNQDKALVKLLNKFSPRDIFTENSVKNHISISISSPRVSITLLVCLSQLLISLTLW